MSNNLSDFKIKAAPKRPGFFGNHDEQRADHLETGDVVAITVDGLTAHKDHEMWSKIAIGSGIGFVALPVLAGFGGIGLAMGGEAMGIGALEVAAIGSGAGAAGGKVLTNERRNWFSKVKDEVALADMVGSVNIIRERWFGQPGYDVHVIWVREDRNGDPEIVAKGWHDPRQLYALERA